MDRVTRQNTFTEGLIDHVNPGPQANGEFSRRIIYYLILDALAYFGPNTPTEPSQIKEYIKAKLFLDFDEAEIVQAATQIRENGYLIVHPPTALGEHPQLQISQAIYDHVNKNIAELSALAEEIMGEWKTELLIKYYREVDVKAEIPTITNSLQTYLTLMIMRHGIKSSRLLLPEDANTPQWIESIQTSVKEELPSINKTADRINQIEIPGFFQRSNAKRKDYLFRVFNAGFIYDLIRNNEAFSSRMLNALPRSLDIYYLHNLVGFWDSYFLDFEDAAIKQQVLQRAVSAPEQTL